MLSLCLMYNLISLELTTAYDILPHNRTSLLLEWSYVVHFVGASNVAIMGRYHSIIHDFNPDVRTYTSLLIELAFPTIH